MSVMRACVARLNYVALEFSYYMMPVVRKEAAKLSWPENAYSLFSADNFHQ